MSTDTDNVVTAFPQSNQQRAFHKLGVKRVDPRLEAVLSKLVPVGSNVGRTRTNQSIRTPDQGILQKISNDTAQAAIDANNLLQVLPDIELSMLILISTILSPKDMVNTELTYRVENGVFNSELTGQMVQIVREHFDSVYKIIDLLQPILKDSLFKTGSYPLLVLPESSIDDIINSKERVSMEAIKGEFKGNDIYPLGILGNKNDNSGDTHKVGLESIAEVYGSHHSTNYSTKITLTSDKSEKIKGLMDYVTIVDNPNVLKVPRLRDKIRQDKIQDALSSRKMSMEAFDETVPVNQRKSLYRQRRYKSTPILAVKPASTLEKPTFGNPLVMHLPSESVIPVHVPGSPEDHIGYFVLLDENGNPIDRVYETDYYRDLQQSLDKTQQPSNLAQNARQGFTGINQDLNNSEELRQLDATYGDLMESELINRLRFGLYGNDVEISKDHQVYRVMLARALSKMHTQILYIPEELLTYIAFDYNAYGVGISLLEKSKIIGSLRSTLMFANTMASIKNSLGRTLLNITLDPEDPDPSTTVEFLISEYARTTRSQIPVGIANPADILTVLQNAGVDVAVSGNTRYPETKMEIEDKQSNRQKPDTELEDSMRKRHIQTFGLSPEMVDNGNNADFAASVIQNNLLLSKRVMMYQKILTAFLSDFIRKYTLNSEDLMEKLREVLASNRDKISKTARETMREDISDTGSKLKDGQKLANRYTKQDGGLTQSLVDHAIDRILFDFITALEVSLPDPDILTLKNQIQAFDDYCEALKKALDAYIDTTFLDNNTTGELSEVVESTKAALFTHFQRQWLRENNLLPEIDALVTVDDEGVPGLDLAKVAESHVEGLQKTILTYMEKLLQARKGIETRYNAVKSATGVDTNPISTGETGSEFADTGDGTSGGSGDDIFGEGGDIGDVDTAIKDDGASGDTESSGGEETSSSSEETSSSKTETSSDGTTTTTSSSSSSSSSSGSSEETSG